MSITLILVVVLAVGFDFINGFHDTANTVATTISTRALSPKTAILLTALFNLVGALSNQKVAGSVAKDIVNNQMINLQVVIGALLAAIMWNLLTWYFGIPSSSSHALFGSLIGATVSHNFGLKGVMWLGVLKKIIIPLFSAPIIGFVLGFIIMKILNLCLKSCSPGGVNKWMLRLQIVSASFMSYTHGSNDAQKSMGIITLALIASNANNGQTNTPFWVVFVCATAIALGTSIGGWRIIKTVGGSIMKMKPADGFVAQTGSAIIIEMMSWLGNPVSTTQIITTSIMGVGASKRLSAVKWIVAHKMVVAWLVTIPVTAVLGAIFSLIVNSAF